MFDPHRAEAALPALRQTIKELHSQLDAAGGRFLFGSKNQSFSEVKRHLEALRKWADRAAGKQGAETGAWVPLVQSLLDRSRAYLAEQESAGGKNAARVQAVQAVAAAAEEWLRPDEPEVPAAEDEPEVPAAAEEPEEGPAVQPESVAEEPAEPVEPVEPVEEEPPEPMQEEADPVPVLTPDTPSTGLTAQERSRLRLGQFAFRRSAGRDPDGAEAALAVVAWGRLERVLDRTATELLDPDAAAAAREAMSGVLRRVPDLAADLPPEGEDLTFCQVKEFLLRASDRALEEEDGLNKPLPRPKRRRSTKTKAAALS